MKKIFLLAISFLFYNLVAGQVIYEEVNSKKLNTSRQIKIQLPRNYEKDNNKKYPVILVLDGDYLFEPVAGNVDYFSYWEDMPESIVVGVMQADTRYQDCSFDKTSYMPTGSGAEFFEFLGLELMPYIDQKFRTAKFVIAVGHDFTANFINYYLFKEPLLFNGYINLSPDLAPMMENRIAERIPNIKQKVFYYLATASDDIDELKQSTESLDHRLNQLKSKSFNYYYDNFEDATHYSLAARGIPNALEKIFSVYRPISQKEFAEILMKPEISPYQYLLDKYKVIENLFETKDNIRITDFLAVGAASEKKKDWESLLQIGALAQKQYPGKVIGHYFVGRYYEEIGNHRKAIRTFQNGYSKEDVDYITENLLLDRANKIKSEFGY